MGNSYLPKLLALNRHNIKLLVMFTKASVYLMYLPIYKITICKFSPIIFLCVLLEYLLSIAMYCLQ